MGDISKDFNRSEFECSCGCGFKTVDVELINVLQILRDAFKASITINSACRCEKHNKEIGGSKNSKHKQGIAADIVVDGVSPEVIYKHLDDIYHNKYGLGNYLTFTHIDSRSKKARW